MITEISGETLVKECGVDRVRGFCLKHMIGCWTNDDSILDVIRQIGEIKGDVIIVTAEFEELGGGYILPATCDIKQLFSKDATEVLKTL